MRFSFITRKARDESDLARIRRRATRVGSAEAAWPLRGGGRTVEENRAALERIRRLRAASAD